MHEKSRVAKNSVKFQNYFKVFPTHIEADLDDIHAERLLLLQQRLNKPLTEIVTGIVAKAVDHMSYAPEKEGQKILRILEDHKLLGIIKGDGNLSVDYKNHLWGSD